MLVTGWWSSGLLLVLVLCVEDSLTISNNTQAFLEWVDPPQSKAVALWSDLILPCRAKLTGNTNFSAEVTHQWLFNGASLGSKVSRFFNNSLFIPSISEQDLGNYSCMASISQSTAQQVVESLTGTATVIEAYIQPFLIDPVSTTSSFRQEVVLTCVTGRGAPSLQVWWLRNGEVFTKGTEQTANFGNHDSSGLSVQLSLKLTFTLTELTAGYFMCVAFNSILGTEVRSQVANVTLELAVSASKPELDWGLPPRLIVSEGQRFLLPCPVKEVSKPITGYWYKGKYRVDESKRLYVLPNNSLVFLPVGPRDAGNYSCVVENSRGITQSPNVELVTAYLGQGFLVQPKDTFALYDQNVTLTCQPPDSVPAAVVVWYKDDLPVNLSSARVKVIENNLILTSVMKADKGLYFCVASNNWTTPASRTSDVARLNVEGPPRMIQPPIKTLVVKGKLLHLVCLVESDPSPTVTWQFEGNDLPNDSKVSVVNQGQELWITGVGKEWQGRFSCLSRNKYGHISADADVLVLVAPVSLRSIGNITSKVNDSVLIPCPVVSDPMPIIEWFYDGTKILVNGSLASAMNMSWIFKSPNLLIDHVEPGHAGKYSCMGFNTAGNISSTGWLTVYKPPVITQAPSNKTAMIGSSVELTCQGEGHPVPYFQWLYNFTKHLPPSTFPRSNVSTNNNNNNNYINTSSLVVPAVSWESAGLYTCLVENEAGRAAASAAVKLLVPAKIEEVHFPSRPVKILTSFNLSCSVSGIPAPLVQWTHVGGEAVKETLNGRVRIPEPGVVLVESAFKNDSGQYECVANSSIGQLRRTASVIVYGPPSPPVLLRAIPLSSESVYLIWEWSDRGDPAEWADAFHIFLREKFNHVAVKYFKATLANETRVELVGLQPATDYVFYVAAVNDAGEGQPSNSLSARTLQSWPSLPVNLQTSAITATSATLTWEVPVSTNGIVKLYMLNYQIISNSTEAEKSVNISDTQSPRLVWTLSPLVPYSDYQVQVCACNIDQGQTLCGNYSSLTFRTAASAPSMPPQSVKVETIDQHSLRVTWKKIPPEAQHGPLQFYHVLARSQFRVAHIGQVNSSLMSYTVPGLYPWRYYSVTVRGENSMGMSPESDFVTAWTLPSAPETKVRNLQLSAASASSIQLSWQAIPMDEATCNVTGYLLEYRPQGQPTWSSVSLLSNSTHSLVYILQSLLPWTWYECRVAAFTDTVIPGLGPFTDMAVVRTLQGVPSPVTQFSYTVTGVEVIAQWQEPAHIQGELMGYQLNYSILDQQNRTVTSINTTSTKLALKDLAPDTVYNISVAAASGAGWGQTVIALIRTGSPVVQNTVSHPKDVVQAVSLGYNSSGSLVPLLQQSDSGGMWTKHLASIVAGSIVGAIAVIVLTIFICTQCMKYKQKQRMNYAVGGGIEPNDVVTTSYRSLEAPPDVVTISSSHKSPQVSPTQFMPHVTSSSSSSVSNSALQHSATGHKHHAVSSHKKDGKNKDEKRRHSLPRISFPVLSISTRSYLVLDDDRSSVYGGNSEEPKGEDNSGFVTVNPEAAQEEGPTQMAARLRNPHLQSITHEDTISVASETQRRRNRMHSESAAAIAAMRTSQSFMPGDDDKDTLFDFESLSSEVIFNERTVL